MQKTEQMDGEDVQLDCFFPVEVQELSVCKVLMAARTHSLDLFLTSKNKST